MSTAGFGVTIPVRYDYRMVGALKNRIAFERRAGQSRVFAISGTTGALRRIDASTGLKTPYCYLDLR
jgi:hypothetical protein